MIEAILAHSGTEAFRNHVANLLLQLCQVDTTPNADIGVMRQAEAACFDVIERALGDVPLASGRCERRAIDPAIATHPAFSLLHFTKTAARPTGLTPEEAYAGRSNLVYILPGTKPASGGVAVNAHIDVVAPFIAPRYENGTVYGRGACDDKGSVVAIVAALKLLGEVLADAKTRLRRNIVAMFVVEEETGGNGSLSLALDRGLKQFYDSAVVMECTESRLHPANRGAVWYRIDLNSPGLSLLEMAAFVNEELENEGRSIRAESAHPLFPTRPTHTCHGIIGRFGQHPSRICGEVSFRVAFQSPVGRDVEGELRGLLDGAVAEYAGLYGDKAKVVDPATGKPKVDHHYDLRREGDAFVVDVHGRSGHMGSIAENDGAITKMAHMVRALVRARTQLETVAGGAFTLELIGSNNGKTLTLEGGQGFVPTHDIREIMTRVARAAERGAAKYLQLIVRPGRGKDAVRVTFDKLHNAAFDGDPDSPPMRRAIAAAKACGLRREEPITGFGASCDARLFATEYPGMQVITFGPGRLIHAHADDEQIEVDEVCRAAAFLAVYLLSEIAG